MRERIKNFISSRVLSLALLVLYAIVLAVATFVENEYSTQVAKDVVYHALWFILFQFLMVVNLFAVLLKGGYFKSQRWGVFITHGAFIVILIGALVTHITGQEGMLHVREGEKNSTMVVHSGDVQKIINLPFTVELIDFTLKRYPGSSSPSSYESLIVVHADGKSTREHIYMNNTLDIKGYRLFQASYDPDEKGTVLLVNQDAFGRTITYVGYCLLVLGFIISLFIRNGRVVALFRNLAKLNEGGRLASLFLVLMASFLVARVEAQVSKSDLLEIVESHVVPTDHAERFGALPMQDSRGRIMPINTFASEVLRKLHKEESIGELNPEQFLLSMWLMPDVWMTLPFIVYDDSYIQNKYSLPDGEYLAYIDIFDRDGNYKFQDDLEAIYSKNANERTTSEKELLKIDEKVNIVDQLFKYRMVRLFPDEADPTHRWYAPGDDISNFEGGDSLFVSKIFHWYLSEVGGALTNDGSWSEANRVLDMIPVYQNAKGKGAGIDQSKIDAELKYNKLNIFAKCKLWYLILGGLLLIISFVEMMNPSKWSKYFKFGLWVAVLLVFHFQMMGMGLRWKIGGYAPWSNSYETMVYIAWVSAVAGLLFAKRVTFVFAIATLFAGVVLFVSGLSWMDPEITPLVPVLRSVWLMFHVAVIVAAYGLFGICFLLGLTNMILMIVRGERRNAVIDKGIAELTIINEISIWLGLMLLAVGIFLGAVWANESWGRYWGWDPKETWALITMVLYGVVAHLYMVRKAYSLYIFNLLTLFAFFAVLMTYFGVNYFLTGMHSYNTTSISLDIFFYILGAVVVLSGVGIMAKIRYKNQQQSLK
ncbi:MAG: cytochrome c biogenesis protein CcsA [Rikenellaceae bacterium]